MVSLSVVRLLTKNTDYAIRALCFLAGGGKTSLSVGEIAKELGISLPFLRGILQKLARRGILDSAKGRGGGFRLARPPEKIFVLDLIEIFQGPVELNRCLIKKEICPDVETCPLRDRVEEIERKVVADLGSITVASLLAKPAAAGKKRNRPERGRKR